MQVSVSGPVTEARRAWDCVVETGLMLRLAGAPPVRLRWVEDADGEVVPSGVMLGPAGLRHQFEDRSIAWVRGRFLRFDRQVDGPLLREIHYEARLDETGAGVRPEPSLRVVPRMSGLGMLVRLYTRGVRRGWEWELERLAPDVSASRRHRRPLDMTAAAALSRWTDRGGRPALRARVETWMRQAPARALHDLRPMALARGWGEAGDASLDAILDDLVEAVAAGVLELRWVVKCPRCRAEVLRTDSLSGLTEEVKCPACAAVRPVDLVRTVEVVLSAPGWMGGQEPTCPAVAAWWNDVEAAALLAPGETVELPLSLEPGVYRLVAGAGAESLDGRLVVTKGGPDAARWSPGDGEVALGQGVLVLENTGGRRHFVRVVRPTPAIPVLSAFAMLTRPHFQRRLGGQAPAPDVVLEVGDATVLFTDFTDSTAYFDRMGDRVAVQRVRRRLDAVAACIQACGGARVKTLGDGLMALFASPVGAVRAALELLGSPVCGHPGEPQLRVGISRGAILTEHTDAAGLDCLGATVARGALAVYQAPARSVRWTDRVHDDLGVQRLLRQVPTVVRSSEDGFFEVRLEEG